MTKKPLILITNDDGVFAPGIKALAEAVQGLGELLIVAPRHGQSGMGHSYPVYDEIGIIDEVSLDLNGVPTKAYGVVGSPSTAVVYALKEICDRKPDLCLSGVNDGENVGAFVTCSGTVGAAITASIYGIPTAAFSLAWNTTDRKSEMNFENSKYFVRTIAEKILGKGLSKSALFYNVNIPYSADENTEMKYTTQSNNYHFDFENRHLEERKWCEPSRLKWRPVKNRDAKDFEKDSDIYTLIYENKVSITPMNINLTSDK